ncbi:MAG: hypothetical protein JWP27_998 [Flaviaesturariibacter sp.]|nr:hypothetical protein [Flaviaesturariibacter sp.]
MLTHVSTFPSKTSRTFITLTVPPARGCHPALSIKNVPLLFPFVLLRAFLSSWLILSSNRTFQIPAG